MLSKEVLLAVAGRLARTELRNRLPGAGYQPSPDCMIPPTRGGAFYQVHQFGKALPDLSDGYVKTYPKGDLQISDRLLLKTFALP